MQSCGFQLDVNWENSFLVARSRHRFELSFNLSISRLFVSFDLVCDLAELVVRA